MRYLACRKSLEPNLHNFKCSKATNVGLQLPAALHTSIIPQALATGKPGNGVGADLSTVCVPAEWERTVHRVPEKQNWKAAREGHPQGVPAALAPTPALKSVILCQPVLWILLGYSVIYFPFL
jgi:hypothetical protein